MRITKTLALVAVAAAFVAPGVASATAPWHAPVGDGDATVHSIESKSTKTRAEVMKELEASRKDGPRWYLDEGMPVLRQAAGQGKTREEVRKEVLNLTFEERQQLHMLGGR